MYCISSKEINAFNTLLFLAEKKNSYSFFKRNHYKNYKDNNLHKWCTTQYAFQLKSEVA